MTTAVTRARSPALLQTLAHELRNPLASLQGCAYTLSQSFDELSPPLRRELVEVIVKQSCRLDWLIGAVAASGGMVSRRREGQVDIERALRDAVASANARLEVAGSPDFEGDEKRIELALQALLVALLGGAADGSVALSPEKLEVRTPLPELNGSKVWKLHLARDLLREEGCRMRIQKTPAGMTATVRFPDAENNSRRIA